LGEHLLPSLVAYFLHSYGATAKRVALAWVLHALVQITRIKM